MRAYKRRRYLVHGLQYRLMTAVLIYLFAALFSVVALVFGPLVLGFLGGDAYSAEKYAAAGVFLKLHGQFWPVVLFLTVAITLHSILISHRIAGPLYRFKKTFSAIAEGDLSMRVRIRQGDYPVQEAEELDRMVDALRNRLLEIGEARNRLISSARRLTGSEAEKRAFEAALSNLSRKIDDFKLSSGQSSAIGVGNPSFGPEKSPSVEEF